MGEAAGPAQRGGNDTVIEGYEEGRGGIEECAAPPPHALARVNSEQLFIDILLVSS